jgi:hypothetical protein
MFLENKKLINIMGLDQYAFSRPPSAQMVLPFVEEEEDSPTYDDKPFAEWRKHNRLQGWMEQLWHDKGCPGVVDASDEVSPTPEQLFGSAFNCIDLELTPDDLDALASAIAARHLPETGGFFFGNDSYADYEGEYGYAQYDLEFLAEAKKRIDKGHKVYYGCWW